MDGKYGPAVCQIKMSQNPAFSFSRFFAGFQIDHERADPGRAYFKRFSFNTQDLVLQGGVSVKQLTVTVLPDLGAPLLGMDVLGRLHFSQKPGELRIEPGPGDGG